MVNRGSVEPYGPQNMGMWGRSPSTSRACAGTCGVSYGLRKRRGRSHVLRAPDGNHQEVSAPQKRGPSSSLNLQQGKQWISFWFMGGNKERWWDPLRVCRGVSQPGVGSRARKYLPKLPSSRRDSPWKRLLRVGSRPSGAEWEEKVQELKKLLPSDQRRLHERPAL